MGTGVSQFVHRGELAARAQRAGCRLEQGILHRSLYGGSATPVVTGLCKAQGGEPGRGILRAPVTAGVTGAATAEWMK